MGVKYRKIDPYIWNDRKFRRLSVKGQLAFLFVLTHQHMTALGAMRGTIEGLSTEHHGLSPKAFGEALAEGLLKAYGEGCFLWAPNFLKYNPPESPNVVTAWVKALHLLPECELKDELIIHTLQYVKGLSEAFRKALPKAFWEAFAKPSAKPSPKQEQEQEQEQEQDKKLCALVDFRLNDFALFYKRYPRKKAKEQAVKTWKKLAKSGALPPIEQILSAIDAQVAERNRLTSCGEFVAEWKYPSTWLNSGCWDDEIIDPEEGKNDDWEEVARRAGLRQGSGNTG